MKHHENADEGRDDGRQDAPVNVFAIAKRGDCRKARHKKRRGVLQRLGGCYRHVHGCDDLRYDNAHADDGSQQVQVPDVGCEWDLTNDHHDDGDGQYEHELHEGNVNERKSFFEALNACQNAGAAKRRKKNPKRRHGSVFRRAIVGVSSRILAQGRHKDTADPLHF